MRDVAVFFDSQHGLVSRIRGRKQERLHAVDGVDLQVFPGEALGLVGESGSGKSTLARALVGLQPLSRGEIRFEGEVLPAKRTRAQRRRMQIVFQDPYSSLNPRMTVRQVLAELLRVHKVTPPELGLTLLFIAHNLAVVRHLCDRVAVMYLGRIVEVARTEELFADPRHPYSQGLLQAIPRLEPGRASEAVAVEGDPPSPLNLPSGCRFHPRCPLAQPVCHADDPELTAASAVSRHTAACHFAWPTPPPAPATDVGA